MFHKKTKNMTKKQIEEFALSLGIPKSRVEKGFVFPDGWSDEKMQYALKDFAQRLQENRIDVNKNNAHETLIQKAKQQLDGKTQADLQADVDALMKQWY